MMISMLLLKKDWKIQICISLLSLLYIKNLHDKKNYEPHKIIILLQSGLEIALFSKSF